MRTQIDFILEAYSDRMWCAEQIGSVDELGYYALAEVGDEEKQRDALAYLEMPLEEGGEFLEPGWYVILSDNSGFIYGTCHESEAEARAAYGTLVTMYEKF